MMTWLARSYATAATAIITDSHYSQQVIIQRLRMTPDKIRTIPLTVGSEFFRQPCPSTLLHRYGIDPPYIFWVGNFLPHKNLRRLLSAYAALDPSLRSRYQLVLAGQGGRHRSRLQHEAARQGLTERVRFPGWIDPADLPALYSGCTVFVFPSLLEGFGLPALEAMACGAAVAASNRGAVPEVVGDAAALFDPDDVAAMANALGRLLTDVALREELSRRGVERARQFTRERSTARVVALLEEVAKQRAPHGS
jgi:glycosyltransferase involved in cell wall biosynthesis